MRVPVSTFTDNISHVLTFLATPPYVDFQALYQASLRQVTKVKYAMTTLLPTIAPFTIPFTLS
jgi:hypothetical protein